MPVDPLAASAAGRELEGENFDLGPLGDQVPPAGEVVMVRPLTCKAAGRPARAISVQASRMRFIAWRLSVRGTSVSTL